MNKRQRNKFVDTFYENKGGKIWLTWEKESLLLTPSERVFTEIKIAYVTVSTLIWKFQNSLV